MILCFCFYNENMPSTGCGTESQFLKNCGKQLDVYLFKCFGGRDEVARGVRKVCFPLSGSIWPCLAPEAKQGRPTWDRISYELGKQLHVKLLFHTPLEIAVWLWSSNRERFQALVLG